MPADEPVLNQASELASSSLSPAARILIMDEDPVIRDIAFRKLSSQGYDCKCCADEKIALRLLAAEKFDLVLTGLLETDDGSTTVIRKILQVSPDIAVVLLTTIVDIDLAVNLLKDGAYDYITKPCSMEELSIRVAHALEKRRLLRENENYQRTLQKQVAERTKQLREALGVLEQTYHSTLVALSKALDSRDSDPNHHSLRVTAASVRLARHLGLSHPEIKAIEKGVLLHDIGKLAIPDKLLRPAEALSEAEQLIIRQHPIIGHRILSHIKFLQDSALLVLHHHEHYDGSGYPQGLKGGQIDLGARIFAVVEEFDQLISVNRSGKGLGFKRAMREIKKQAGTLLDPEIVEKFAEIPICEWQELYRQNPVFINGGCVSPHQALSPHF